MSSPSVSDDFELLNAEHSLKRIVQFLPWAFGLAALFYALLWILPLPNPDAMFHPPPPGPFQMAPPRFTMPQMRHLDMGAMLFFLVWGPLAWIASRRALVSGKGYGPTLGAVHLLFLAQSAVMAVLENIDGIGFFGIALGCIAVPGFLAITPSRYRITTALFLACVLVPLDILIDDPVHYVIVSTKALALALLSAFIQYHVHNIRLELHRTMADLRERNAELSLSASCDPLTGLANRRAFEHAFEAEWERSIRDGRAFSLISVDIDHFKKVNDTMGHDFGDRVLKEVGRHLGSAIRQSDMVVRMGGEEFLLFLPGAGTARAAVIAERLRAGLSELETAREFGSPLTASFGVAGSSEAESPDELLRLVDRRLYAAKHAGRDRVVGPETTSPSPAG